MNARKTGTPEKTNPALQSSLTSDTMASEHHNDVNSSTSAETSAQWEVQSILAERSSATGGNEVLVVWQPEWIPTANIQKSGSAWKAWKRTPKWTASAMMMQVMLPIEPESQLQKDCAYVEKARAAEVRRRAEAASQAAILHNRMPTGATGPRKQLCGDPRPRQPDADAISRAVHAKGNDESGSCDDD
jgi:hypothetical protein